MPTYAYQHTPTRDVAQIKTGYIDMLSRFDFHRFVTLRHNSNVDGSTETGIARMRKLIADWDARVNRKILGPNWQHSTDRIWFFGFCEKPELSPHWHLAVRFYTTLPGVLQAHKERFDHWAPLVWAKVCPSGDIDIKPWDPDGTMKEYVVKSTELLHNPNLLIVPDQLAHISAGA